MAVPSLSRLAKKRVQALPFQRTHLNAIMEPPHKFATPILHAFQASLESVNIYGRLNFVAMSLEKGCNLPASPPAFLVSCSLRHKFDASRPLSATQTHASIPEAAMLRLHGCFLSFAAMLRALQHSDGWKHRGHVVRCPRS